MHYQKVSKLMDKTTPFKQQIHKQLIVWGAEGARVQQMSNSMEQTLEGEDNNNNNNRGSEQNPNQSQEWETMARLWLSAFSGVEAVSTMEVETWIDSNYSSLPSDLQSMPRSDLIDRLLSIQKYMRLPTQNQVPFSFLSVKNFVFRQIPT